MKKLLALILACMMVMSCMVAFAADEPVETYPNTAYTATQATAPIVIDGVMDDAYASAEVIPLNNKIMVDLLYEEDEISTGEMRILWDETALYIYAVIKDATYAPAYKDPSWFNNVDSFWFATDASADLTVTNCYALARCGEAYRKMTPEAADIEFVVKNMKDGAEVAMTTYGNADGNYPADSAKPEGEVDSYVLEIKVPYTTAVAGGTGYFGAFLCDDVDFANCDVINLAEGRARSSEAVSTPRDNGIWNTTGSLDEGKVEDAREFFDVLTFVGAEK